MKDWYYIDRCFEWLLEHIVTTKIVIVGAGYWGNLLKDKLIERGIVPICFFDNYISRSLSTNAEIPVVKPEKMGQDTCFIIAVDGEETRASFREQLCSLGVDESQIYSYYKNNHDFWKSLPDLYYKDEISWLYKTVFEKEMNWDNPKTYNEILNWEKINADSPIRTQLADKYRVREWIKEKIGEKYLNILYGVWDCADDIDFEKLPDSFVLKCNHGSGWNIIVKDKKNLDIEGAKKQLNLWMSKNMAYMGFEMQYKNICPKIICEKYLEGLAETEFDYNIFCFHGVPRYIFCIRGCHTPEGKAAFYDTDWNLQSFSHKGYPLDPDVAPRPKQLKEMLELSKKLSEGFEHVRVDWYNMPDGRLLFGEMTFTTWNGLKKFEPEFWDAKFGEMIYEKHCNSST